MCEFSYPPHDADSLSGQEAWIADFIVHNAVKHLLFIISWEWRLPTHKHAHFIQYNPFYRFEFHK